jgi:branched-chain amino acid aminotransferase
MLYNFDGEVFSSFKLSPRLISLLVNQFQNRAFRYGDGLFESIRWQGGKMLLWEEHQKRLQQGAERLKLHWNSQIDWIAEIQKTLSAANRLLPEVAHFPTAWRLRLSIFRKGGGLYTPTENDFSFFLEATPIEDPKAAVHFSYLPALTSYDFYSAYPLPTYSKKEAIFWSSLKSIANAQPYVQAALYKKEKKVEEVFLLNRAGRIAEASAANVFWVEKGILHTPPLSEGCVAGVLRAFLIGQAKKENMAFSEKKCTLQTFEAATEIFLTNAVGGIRILKQKNEGQALFWQQHLEKLWAQSPLFTTFE